MKLIFAQGNPEARYEATRHNIGWRVLDALAVEAGEAWKHDKKHGAATTTISINGEKVLLVKPLSYYNETGRVAQSIIKFYKLTPKTDLLVLHDDLALPFGTLRIREKGSAAGNNGIKSLNAHLGEEYTRLRIGIWNELQQRINDADFVLSSFSKKEQEQLKDVVIPAITPLVYSFVNGSLEPHSQKTIPLPQSDLPKKDPS